MVRVKIVSMILKDILVFFRDYRSFILLFITPLVIAGSIGIVYINSQPTDIHVILCSETERTDMYYKVRQSMVDSDMFWITEKDGNCNETIGNSIRASDARMGIIVNSYPFYGEMSHYNSSVQIIYDNAKPIGMVVQSHLSLIASQASKEIINSTIGLAHDEITSTMSEVDVSLEKISSYLEELKALRNDLAELKNDISETIQIVERIDDMLISIDYMIDDLDDAVGDFEEVEDQIDDAQSRLGLILATLEALNASQNVKDSVLDLSTTLNHMKTTTTNTKNTLINSRNQIRNIRNQINVQELLDAMDDMETELNRIILELDAVISLIEDSINDINSIKDYLSEQVDVVPQGYEEPIKTDVVGYFGNQNYINFMFPTIIITILMWISVFLSSIAFIKQRNQGIIKRMSISPTRTLTIVIEKIFVYTIISLLFLPLIFLLGIYGFGIEISPYSILPIAFIYTIASMTFVLQGLTIGSITKSENAATLCSLMLVVPLMFLSGTFFPEESLPSLLKWSVPYMPINIAVTMISGFFFYEFTIDYMVLMMGRLFVYLFVYSVIAWMFLSKNIKK
ncbi:MAG: ABC transporter permease [Candidatus Aenigmatarchaeota archaeon]|nr:ABC transporter permease [Nanoarchaeota archaeon]